MDDRTDNKADEIMHHIYKTEGAEDIAASQAQQKNLQGWIALGLSIFIASSSAVYFLAAINPRIDALERQSAFQINSMEQQIEKLNMRLERIEQNQISRAEWGQMEKNIERLVINGKR